MAIDDFKIMKDNDEAEKKPIAIKFGPKIIRVLHRQFSIEDDAKSID